MPFDPTDPTSGAPGGGGGGSSLQVPPPMGGMPGRGQSPILQALMGGQGAQPSAPGPGNQADAHGHIQLAVAAVEKAIAGMQDPKDKHNLAQILARLTRISPPQGAPQMGVLQNIIQRIAGMLKQRSQMYAGMQGGGGPAQQMAQAAPQPTPGPPMGAFPGA
jgi:hypothetical protein